MPLTVQGGSLVVRNGALGTSDACCCRCPLGECRITIEFLDENGCEDDVFDLYLKNPTTNDERFIQRVDLKSTPAGKCGDPAEYANIKIPVTVTPTDFDADCKVIIGLRYVSANCCNTWARFRIRRPNGCLLYGQYFGQGGLETTYTWLELCNDDPCPPPPPKPCCSKIVQCEDYTVIQKCGAFSYQECCSSNTNSNEEAAEDCDGEEPPVTNCEIGATPSPHAPYDCLNGSFEGGAWVNISGWKASIQEIIDDGTPITGDYLLANAFLESKINQTFFVPFDCLGAGQVTFDLGDGETYPGGSVCSGAHLFLYISVNLCARTASARPRHPGCYGVNDIEIDLGELTSIGVPCNSFTGCNCEGYSGSIPAGGISGGGTLTVSSS
jgi:hypothetical protein